MLTFILILISYICYHILIRMFFGFVAESLKNSEKFHIDHSALYTSSIPVFGDVVIFAELFRLLYSYFNGYFSWVTLGRKLYNFFHRE